MTEAPKPRGIESYKSPETAKDFDPPDYKWLFEVGISRIEAFQGQAIQALYVDNWHFISRAPGSSGNHQPWPGGYMDHIRQFNGFVEAQYALMVVDGIFARLPAEERFTLNEALAVGALHDIEKPFIYTPTSPAGSFVRDPRYKDKEQKAELRQQILNNYHIQLTDNQLNAMSYVEGIPDSEYTPGSRIMGPLAALCHMADTYSARICYSQ